MRLFGFLVVISLTCYFCTSSKREVDVGQLGDVNSTGETFVKQSIDLIANTTWIFRPFPNCTDTLTLRIGDGVFFLCEFDLDYRIEYSVQSDTLYVDLYELISEVDSSLGEHIQTKYKFIKANDKLIIVEVAHRVGETFEPIANQRPIGEYEQIKN